MRNCITAFLVLGLLLPALLPLAPNSTVHALYDFHMSHHDTSSHHQEPHIYKFHSNGMCFYQEDEDIPHHIPTDLNFYYKDIMHIDFIIKDKDIMVRELLWDQDFNYDLDIYLVESNRFTLRNQQKRGPPISHYYVKNYPSIYLTTLRIRI